MRQIATLMDLNAFFEKATGRAEREVECDSDGPEICIIRESNRGSRKRGSGKDLQRRREMEGGQYGSHTEGASNARMVVQPKVECDEHSSFAFTIAFYRCRELYYT